MALVQGGAEGIIRWLMRNAVDLAREEAAALANEILQNAAVQGANAVNEARAVIREAVEDGLIQLHDRTRQGLTTLVEGVAGEIQGGIQAIRNLPGNIQARNQEENRLAWEARGRAARERHLTNREETTLDELIPENDMDRASEPEPELERAAAFSGGGGGPGGPVSKETPVTFSEPSYGLQETHTTLCNWNGWVSCVGTNKTEGQRVEVRLTSPSDILAITLSATPAFNTAWTRGIYAIPYNDANTTDTLALTNFFPTTLPTGVSATEKANWFAYWAQLYEYYTVIKCDYEITMDNPSTSNGADNICFWGFNSTSTTAGISGNQIPRDGAMIEMMQWKGLKKVNLPSSSSSDIGYNSRRQIRGTYYPGQAKRNIVNDGDVKTWIKTMDPVDPGLPTLQENLVMYFFEHPLLNRKQNVGVSNTMGVNVQITMKYTVQFKDLRENARYPRLAGAAIQQILETDAMQIPGA